MNARQMGLFDATEGARRRDAGKARASSGHQDWLRDARWVAVQIARRQGTVNADDVRAAGVRVPEGASPNIFGALFNDERFVFDRFVYSKRPEAHRNLLRQWRLSELRDYSYGVEQPASVNPASTPAGRF